MSEISAIWERIEAWYKAQGATEMLESGASAAAIAQTERELGLLFPTELKESLMRHNGSGSLGWPEGELLSLARIADERQVWMELLEWHKQLKTDMPDEYEFYVTHNADSTKIQAGWWNPGWIPLHADGGGNGMVIDTAPAAAGAIGQVLFMNHETGPTEPLYTSLSAYLKDIAKRLENGEFVFEDGIIARGGPQ